MNTPLLTPHPTLLRKHGGLRYPSLLIPPQAWRLTLPLAFFASTEAYATLRSSLQQHQFLRSHLILILHLEEVHPTTEIADVGYRIELELMTACLESSACL